MAGFLTVDRSLAFTGLKIERQGLRNHKPASVLVARVEGQLLPLRQVG